MRRYLLTVGALAAVWAVVATVLVPVLIRSAYAGESWGFLNDMVAGQSTHSVEDYLADWSRWAVRLSLLFAAGAALLGVLVRTSLAPLVHALRRGMPDLSGGDLLVLATLCAVAAGLTEAVHQQVSYRLLHRAAGAVVSAEVFWMAPLAASVTFIGIALSLVAAGRLTGHGRVLRGAGPLLLVGLAVYSFGRSLGAGLHPLALVVLSCGFGSWASRWLRDHAVDVRLPARRLVGACVAGLAVLALAVGPARRLHAAWVMRDLPPAAQASPNVLLIVWDTVRAMSLSLYGYERETTPNLERLAERGLVFEQALAPAPWTLPSHASMFTGRYHHEHSARHDRPLDDTHLTLAEALRARGYDTGGFIANEFYVGPGFGLDRGFNTYEYWKRPTPLAIASTWWITGRVAAAVAGWRGTIRTARIPAEDVEASFVEWLDERDGQRPFFAFLNLFDAHDPYVPPASFGFRYSQPGGTDHWGPPDHEYSAAELQELRDAYDSCIYYLDHELGLLLDELERRGVLDNTLVIVTSDHGETLGEHAPDLLGHWTNIYYDVLRVPLVLALPSRIREGAEVETPVSLVDLPRTVLDLVSDEGANPFPGRSLVEATGEVATAAPRSRPALAESHPSDWHERFPNWPISRGPLRSLVEGRHHYIVDAAGVEQLFDVRRDPWERSDLSRTRAGAAALSKFREAVRVLSTSSSPASPPL